MFGYDPMRYPELDLFDEARIVIQSLRELALAHARDLVKEYSDRRTELQMAEGDSFIGLVLVVRARSENRSIQISWGTQHFKNRKLVGTSDVRGKKRGETSYDVHTLQSQAPTWAKELVKEYELKARPIRDALQRLTEMDTDLRVVTTRLKKDTHAEQDEGEV